MLASVQCAHAVNNEDESGFNGSVAVGDLNGDGKADLAVVNNGDNYLSVLLNKGDGTFAGPLNHATGVGPTSVVLGDLNGDGRADLAVANLQDSNLGVFLNTGNGAFAMPVNFSVGYQPRSIALGDLNGDGLNDLAVTVRSGCAILLNTTH